MQNLLLNASATVVRLLAISLLSGVGIASAATTPARHDGESPWVPGELMVKLRPEAAARAAFSPAALSSGRTGLAALDLELERLDATALDNLFRPEVNPERKRAIGLDRTYRVRYRGTDTPPDAANRLAASPEIEWAEPNFTVHLNVTPNDTNYELQWGLKNRGQAEKANGDTVGTVDCDIDGNQAWDVELGSSTVVIAIVDTGVDTGHPEFSGRMQSGWDFWNNDSNPTDDNGHGTSCAGIAAARGNNGQGVAGVAWGVRILPIKVLPAVGSGNTAVTSAGIIYAADFGADVISLSLGTESPSQTGLDAVNYAYGFDCAMFAATGNDDQSTIEWPAAYDHVMAVGALSPCNQRKNPASCDGETGWGSDWGTGLDFLAPGVRIHTTDIRGSAGYDSGDYYDAFAGTSAATPFAAGIGALIRSRVNISADDLAQLLFDTCDDLGAAGYDTQHGWGRMNAYVALRRATGAICVGFNTGFENGTYRSPYNTLHEGFSFVPVDNYVLVKPGIYDEITPWNNINKKLHVDAVDGGVSVR